MSKAKKILRLVLSSVLLLLLALMAAATGMFLKISKTSGTTPLGLAGLVSNPRGHFPADQSRLNVLLIGKDYNHVNKKGVNYGILHSKGARSDTLVVLSLDLDKRKVSALSIPRDTYTEYPPGLPGRIDKINAAYAWGGAPLAMQTVANLLGVPIHHHIALKADAVKTLVDQLGGVEVEALDRMKYDDNWGNLHIDLPRGKQSVDGDRAVQFTRFRKQNSGEPRSKEEGDERRMARQQQLLRAMMRKAKQPEMFLKAPELIQAGLGAIETDLKREQLYAIALLFKDVQPEQMQTASLAHENFRAGGKWFVRPVEEKMKAQVEWLLQGDETAANRLTVVAVSNGTKIRGAAREVAEALRTQGFDAKSAGNTAYRDKNGETAQTLIAYGLAAVAPRALRVAEVLGAPAPTKKPVEELKGADVVVVLGRDVAPTFAAEQEAALR